MTCELGCLYLHYAWGGAMLFLATLGMGEKGRLVVFQEIANLNNPWNGDEILNPKEWL